MKFAVWLFFFAVPAFACDVIYLPFNFVPNNPQGEIMDNEVGYCAKGVAEHDPNDKVIVVGGGKKTITPALVAKELEAERRAGRCVDSIVLSGHQIAGWFSGRLGKINAQQLKSVFKRYPDVAGEHLKTAQLYGCYSTVLVRCKKDFLTGIDPHITTAIGYATQSPANTREADWKAAKYFCGSRDEAAKAQTEEAINKYVSQLPNRQALGFSICIGGDDGQGAICSDIYKEKGVKNPSCYVTYRQLEDRCGNVKDFDPKGMLAQEYEKYYSAVDDQQHADPPCEGGNGFDLSSLSKNLLRKFYDVGPNLWGHCVEYYKQPGIDYTLPDPAKVIRLIKYCDLKRNIQKNHADELSQYNNALEELGLGQFKLKDLNKISRYELVQQLNGAINSINAGEYRNSSSVDPNKLQRMANSISATLVDLDGSCSDAAMLHPEGTTHRSGCITDLDLN